MNNHKYTVKDNKQNTNTERSADKSQAASKSTGPSTNQASNTNRWQNMANGSSRVAQLKTKQSIADGVIQAKTVQLWADKLILPAAQRHYNDGWGALYGIRNNVQLRARVPNRFRGAGTINLGVFVAPAGEQVAGAPQFSKNCEILYRDAGEGGRTVIYHCGPSGLRLYPAAAPVAPAPVAPAVAAPAAPVAPVPAAPVPVAPAVPAPAAVAPAPVRSWADRVAGR